MKKAGIIIEKHGPVIDRILHTCRRLVRDFHAKTQISQPSPRSRNKPQTPIPTIIRCSSHRRAQQGFSLEDLLPLLCGHMRHARNTASKGTSGRKVESDTEHGNSDKLEIAASRFWNTRVACFARTRYPPVFPRVNLVKRIASRALFLIESTASDDWTIVSSF